jgi:hypothetical protein
MRRLGYGCPSDRRCDLFMVLQLTFPHRHWSLVIVLFILEVLNSRIAPILGRCKSLKVAPLLSLRGR